MTSTLTEFLADRIRQEGGKITFHEWMNWALYYPNFGYYLRPDLVRWGREGDYRTSPERSDLFGATFARYFVSLYDQMGSPSAIQLVEFGAGNGKFAISVLAALKRDFPEVFESVNYSIVETYSYAALSAEGPVTQFKDKISYVGLAELQATNAEIVFSNELFDSFAVHRVRKVDGQLQELYVGLKDDEQFIWLLGDLSEDIRSICEQYIPNLAEGQTVEVNPGIGSFFALLEAKRMSGYVVTVDYGADREELYNQPQRFDGTLRGFSGHKFVDDILSEPGAYDITSTIDWSYAKDEGEQHGFVVDEFQPLDKFLLKAGILDELEKRMTNAVDEVERASLTTAAREMILPSGMASSFQVLVQKRKEL